MHLENSTVSQKKKKNKEKRSEQEVHVLCESGGKFVHSLRWMDPNPVLFAHGRNVFGSGRPESERRRGVGVASTRSLLDRDVSLTETLPALLGQDVDHLCQVQDHAQGRCAAHDVEEDLLLCGFGDVAVHRVGTGALRAPVHPRNLKSTIHEVEDEQRAHLEGRLQDQAEEVRAQQTTVDTAFIFIKFAAVFFLAVLAIRHVQGHQQGWRGHHDELQSPQTCLRHGEQPVEADVLAAGLLSVTHEILRLVFPDVFCSGHEHHDAEDEEHGEPKPTNHSGVFIHAAQDALQERPVHDYRRKRGAVKIPYSVLLLRIIIIISYKRYAADKCKHECN